MLRILVVVGSLFTWSLADCIDYHGLSNHAALALLCSPAVHSVEISLWSTLLLSLVQFDVAGSTGLLAVPPTGPCSDRRSSSCLFQHATLQDDHHRLPLGFCSS
jgi:hypothetical protein